MRTTARKAAWLSSLGAALEYFDFIIYGMMAEYLSPLFFAGDEAWLGLVKAFVIFAVGYVARPFGGIFFGMIGDTFGRKKTFLSVMLLMSSATFGIGLLPTYAQIGALAPCLLLLFRLLQGMSFGAELPGAMTVVCEYADKQQQGACASIVVASTSVGAMLASLVLYLLSGTISREQILNGGWRIPFLLGGSLAIASYYIRNNLQETPEYSRCHKDAARKPGSMKDPLVDLLQQHWRELLQGIGMTLFISSLVIVALYLPTYLTLHFDYRSSDVYLAILLSMLWSAIILPITGHLADAIDKRVLFAATACAFVVGAFPLFALLKTQSFYTLLLFMILYQTVIALASSCYYPILASLFPTRMRYTGMAACYNVSYALMAALPLVLTALISYTATPISLNWVLMALALLSMFSIELGCRRRNWPGVHGPLEKLTR
jgi:MHS family proline/betaine transporter-like MFS transporter